MITLALSLLLLDFSWYMLFVIKCKTDSEPHRYNLMRVFQRQVLVCRGFTALERVRLNPSYADFLRFASFEPH